MVYSLVSICYDQFIQLSAVTCEWPRYITLSVHDKYTILNVASYIYTQYMAIGPNFSPLATCQKFPSCFHSTLCNVITEGTLEPCHLHLVLYSFFLVIPVY